MSIFSGIEKGLTGIITQPLEGAKNGGFEGFLEGTFKGITGLVTKPITGKYITEGVLDGNAKFAESIKN